MADDWAHSQADAWNAIYDREKIMKDFEGL